jgi:hypothetical protein
MMQAVSLACQQDVDGAVVTFAAVVFSLPAMLFFAVALSLAAQLSSTVLLMYVTMRSCFALHVTMQSCLTI